VRILQVSDTYAPTVGGIEWHVRDLSEQLRAAGHDVVVATATPGNDDPDVIRLSWRPPAVPTRTIQDLRSIVARGDWDAVHVHSSLVSPLAWSAARAASATRVPAVLTMHSMVPTVGLRAQALRGVLQGAGMAGCVLTAVSTAAARALLAVVPRRQVSVLPNGIDAARWRPAAAVTAADRPLTVISVMRLARRKRPLALLSVLHQVRRLLPRSTRIEAHIVGSGSQWLAVADKTSRLDMEDWVRLPGQLGRPDIRSLLHASDVYLAPATHESFGIAALEARCAGLPVVAMAQGGVGDFIRDGVEGLLVQSDGQMAAATAGLLADRTRLAAMQRHNATTSPPVTWDSVIASTVEIYAAARERVGPERLPRRYQAVRR
jgi:glycosyltransferase involved in cell wall biosynthesis